MALIWQYVSTRPYEIGSWLTRGLNVILGGKAAETTSARAYRLSDSVRVWDLFRRLINLLFLPFEKNHCLRSYLGRLRRAQETVAEAKTRSIT